MNSEIYVHPTALVEADSIGEGTKIWAFAHVLEGATIGRNCNIGDHCFVESGAVVGDNVTIKNGIAIWEGVTLHDDVFVGPSAVFTNDLFPRSPRSDAARTRYADHSWLVATIVERGATIGAGAIVVAGNRVGAFALVAAGALVAAEVPAYALVRGVPARVAGWVCECGEGLVDARGTLTCPDCGRRYKRERDALKPVSADD
jgi:UDP-2-acetamido-3-amino-2,3-dideoxy-glucuronate N-acetyltransferase